MGSRQSLSFEAPGKHGSPGLRYRLVRGVSSEALAVTAEPAWLGPNPVARSMLSMDPPRHTPLRALVTRAFGPAGMARLEAQVRRVSESLAEAAVRQGEVELVDAFTFAQPRNIIGAMLGLDPSTMRAAASRAMTW
ncbi:hypothetical protein [Archangium violaceum]|uniref:hypothetical protein n=1 Tax=Archangium violaceum TaxID=83451 RepID=UPI00069646E1|nr:hypothetical protein [Archangium violaceum]